MAAAGRAGTARRVASSRRSLLPPSDLVLAEVVRNVEDVPKPRLVGRGLADGPEVLGLALAVHGHGVGADHLVGLLLGALLLVGVDDAVGALVLHEVEGLLLGGDGELGNHRVAHLAHLQEAVQAPAVLQARDEVTQVWLRRRSAAGLLPGHRHLLGRLGVPEEGHGEDVAGVAVDDPLARLGAQAVGPHDRSAGVALAHGVAVVVELDLRCDHLAVVLVPRQHELDAEEGHGNLESEPPAVVRLQLLELPARPSPRDVVLTLPVLALLPVLLPLPLDGLARILARRPAEDHEVLVAWAAEVLLGGGLQVPPVDAPHLVDAVLGALVRAHDEVALPGFVLGGVDLPLGVPVLQDVELLPHVLAQGDAEDVVAVLLLHVLPLRPPGPGAADLVAVLLPIGHERRALRHRGGDGVDEDHLVPLLALLVGLLDDLLRRVVGVVVGELVLQVDPLLPQGLLGLHRLLGGGVELLAPRPALGLVHADPVLGVQGGGEDAAAVVEPPAPLVDLHQVVDVGLQLPGVDLVHLPADGPPVELHPRGAVDVLDGGPRVLVHGLPVVLHLPGRQRQHPGDVVPADLVHRGGAARAVGEDDEDASQRLLPLAHDDGAHVQEGRHGVARADDLEEVHGRHQPLLHQGLPLLVAAIGVVGSAHALEGLLHDVEAAAGVEDVVVRVGEEGLVVLLLLQALVAGVDARHVGVDAVLAVHDRRDGPPTDRLEEVEAVHDARGPEGVVGQRGIREEERPGGGSADREQVGAVGLGDIRGDGQSVAAVPSVGLHPIDAAETGRLATVAGVVHVDALDVGLAVAVALEQVHDV
mmetsp:Transcript_17883/g.56350  ORF Transcript_17883/g.56350 Transcript_17883/m.56350 type:complete len:814 (-) Transcript_17883:587-3028(-)